MGNNMRAEEADLSDPARRATVRLRRIVDRIAATAEEADAVLQYVSAIVALEEQQAYLEAFYDLNGVRTISIRDWAGELYEVSRPAVVTPELEALLVAECRHLASGSALHPMDARLFERGYFGGFCARCRSAFDLGPACRECLFAGYPINYDEVPGNAQ